MRRIESFFWVFMFLLVPSMLSAQGQAPQENERIFAILRDIRGERLEGYLQRSPDEIVVSTKDHQEKSIPLKMIESIKVEKIPGGIPGSDSLGGESYYFVRLQNSQEIFTLKKQVTFSLNTSAGIVTRTIDPETVRDFPRKDSSSTVRAPTQQSLIRGEGVVFSLEIKF
ncbi:MAG TPA: hypothetical protein VLZ03_14320 [Thermodesulfobacteriota bacterium]|nr:hypothetical protein [Thermodesulfobacteriota bacterium]